MHVYFIYLLIYMYIHFHRANIEGVYLIYKFNSSGNTALSMYGWMGEGRALKASFAHTHR